MRAVPAVVAGALVLLALSNCNREMCACPPIATPVLLKGHVREENNTGVPRAVVRAYSAPGTDCTSIWEDFGAVESSADGSFSMWLPSMTHQDAACIFVFARPPQGSSGLTNSDTALVIMDFDPSIMDSARVDLILRPRT